MKVTKHIFWKALILCFLTTQQRSGSGSHVDRFLKSERPLLDVTFCSGHKDLATYTKRTLQVNGFRRATTISSEIAQAIEHVEGNVWREIETGLKSILVAPAVDEERAVARDLQEKFKGLGPKQSRNLIQLMGLSQYEIPLDSRIMKILKHLDFPIPLSTSALADEGYYCFVEDGLRQMLSDIRISPCIFDACAFASLERK